MKRWVLVPALLLCGVAHSQDYCKQIIKESSDENTLFSYTTPFDEKNVPPIRAERHYSTDAADGLDNFFLVMEAPCKFEDILQKTDSSEGEKEETKIVIEFDDHSKIEDDTIKIVHDNSAGDGTAKRIAYYPINEENIKSLTAKRIIKITLATGERDVPEPIATPMQHYLQCMWDVKKK
jgi:hypothetical protein